MQWLTLFLLSAVLAVALAGGQYYVPRAYYTIDAEGHASAPVPLRRLRRSPNFYPRPIGDSNANANSIANASNGGSASATSTANAGGSGGPAIPGVGGWGLGGTYGSAKPLGAGVTRRIAGTVPATRSVSSVAVAGVDDQGHGYYDNYASVYQ